MKMLDPFSTVAASVSLVDITLKLAREIRSLITSLRDAPNGLTQVREIIYGVEHLLEEVQHLVNAYRNSPTPGCGSSRSLDSITRAVRSIDEDLEALRTKIEAPILYADSRRRRLLKAFRFYQHEPSIRKICSQIERKVAWVQAMLNVVGRNNDLYQIGQVRTTNESNQLIIHSQSQLRNEALAMLETNTSISQQILRGQQQTNVDVVDGLAQIRADVLAALHTSHISAPLQVLLYQGSAQAASELLGRVNQNLSSVLAKASLPGTRLNDFAWVGKEICNMLSSVHFLAASELQGGLSRFHCGARRPTQPLFLQFSNHLRSQSSSVIQGHKGRIQPKKAYTQPATDEMELSVALAEGNLTMWITSGSTIATSDNFPSSSKGFRVMFTPAKAHGLLGLSASFLEAPDSHLKIPPAIQTFGVVPEECEIIERIWDGDILGVREILQSRECSAADKDEFGNSLLVYSIEEKDYDMCNLLIQFGADPLDCTTIGQTALEIFFNPLGPQDGDIPVHDFVRLFAASGCFECDTAAPFCSYNNNTPLLIQSPAWFNLCSYLRTRRISQSQLQFLLTHALDVNERDSLGTSLLGTASTTHFTNMVPLGRLLLQSGADIAAVNRFGENVVYSYLRRLSACDASILRGQHAEDMSMFLHELVSKGASVHGGGALLSPSDTALTPATWVIWCQALSRSGIDIEALLQREDRMFELETPSLEEIRELVIRVTGWRTVTLQALSGERGSERCSICEGDRDSPNYRPPFDLGYSRVRPVITKHVFELRHINGVACGNYLEPGTCHEDDHDQHGYPVLWREDLSIRKWAAYQLWKDGWLATPEDAVFWATDAVTQEALDSFHHLSAIRL